MTEEKMQSKHLKLLTEQKTGKKIAYKTYNFNNLMYRDNKISIKQTKDTNMTTDSIVIGNETYYQFEDTQIYASIHGKCANKLTGKVFANNMQNTGYYAIFFRNLHTGKTRRMSVHRIICSVYHKNLDPSIFTQVDHINGNRLDNRACNLRFASPKQNSYYKNHEQGVKWKAPRYSDYKKATMVLLKELGYSHHKIARTVGLHPSSVSLFLKNNKKDTI